MVTATYQGYHIFIKNTNASINSIEVPLENEHPETGEVWKMKMKEGYKIFFSIEDWTGEQYEFDPEILSAYLYFLKVQDVLTDDIDVVERGVRQCEANDFDKT